MNKMLLSLFLLPAFMHASDELQQAVLEVNVAKVEQILKERPPLTDWEKIGYIKLANQIVQEKYDTKIIYGYGYRSGKVMLGLISCIFGIGFSLLYGLDVYEHKKVQVLPICVAAGIFFISYLLFKKGYQEEADASNFLNNKYLDSLVNQQKVYNAKCFDDYWVGGEGNLVLR